MEAVFLQYGALGAIALLALMAVKVMYSRQLDALRREQERADRLEAQLLNLHETIRNEYTNTLGRSSQAINDATRAVADALAAVRKS